MPKNYPFAPPCRPMKSSKYLMQMINNRLFPTARSLDTALSFHTKFCHQFPSLDAGVNGVLAVPLLPYRGKQLIHNSKHDTM